MFTLHCIMYRFTLQSMLWVVFGFEWSTLNTHSPFVNASKESSAEIFRSKIVKGPQPCYAQGLPCFLRLITIIEQKFTPRSGPVWFLSCLSYFSSSRFLCEALGWMAVPRKVLYYRGFERKAGAKKATFETIIL